uniref:Non-structural maintenance of chromosomes element 4 n=1 Tax=Setaria digitata TaxID=48799 RepID=A0A915PYJ1_9BILA
MDEDVEIMEDGDQYDTVNNRESELEFHVAAQKLCEKIGELTTTLSEGGQQNDDLCSQKYLKEIDKLEDDFIKNQSCRYIVTDAKLTKCLSKLIATEVESFHNNSIKKRVTLDSFTHSLKNYLRKNCCLVEEDGEVILDNQQSAWAAFGSYFMNDILKIPPTLSCLGPLLLEETPNVLDIQANKLKRSAGGKAGRAKFKKSDEMLELQEVEEDELQRRTDPLAKELDNVMRCLKWYLKQHRMKSINYFEFCFHPTDFSRSVANAFYTSFLLKENKVGLDIGDDKMPRLRLIGNAEQKAAKDSNVAENRGVVSFSYNDWQEIVKLLNIKVPIITDY